MAKPNLHAIKFAVAGGIVTVITIFLTGLMALIFPGAIPVFTDFYNQLYGFFGFQAGFFILLLMSIGSFIDGFILTWIFAWIYNKL